MAYTSPLLAFISCYFFILIALKFNIFSTISDIPNHRSLHSIPTPRSGGIFIMMSIFPAWAILNIDEFSPIIYSALIIFIISLIDDVSNISPIYRIIMQTISGACFIYLTNFDYMTIQLILLVIIIVYSSNMFNFMDGADGLASGYAFIGFGFYGVNSIINGNTYFGLFNFSISLACLAFLFFNYQPAKIFMGDSGSVTLGFLASVIGIYGWNISVWEYYYPFLVFSFFLLDSTYTLILRLANRKNIFTAHKEHIYQKAIACGFSHKKTMMCYLISSFIVNFLILFLVYIDSSERLVHLLLLAVIMYFFITARIVNKKFNIKGR